jgi:SAM-dependent methyltransferase
MADAAHRLYSDLAHWWPLFSPPIYYIEEAADLLPLLNDGSKVPGRTLLELGSGGGSLAFHLKEEFVLTLTDRSAQMLAVSSVVNPECEHLCGDMTTLDLGRQFDRVLVHDAITYALTPDAVRAALGTAARHCRPGGLVIVLPDHVRETFAPSTESGGDDAPDGRGLRYVEWTWDQNPDDHVHDNAFAFLLREADGTLRTVLDHHQCGLFARADWLQWCDEAGLDVRIHHDEWNRDVFAGRRRSQAIG